MRSQAQLFGMSLEQVTSLPDAVQRELLVMPGPSAQDVFGRLPEVLEAASNVEHLEKLLVTATHTAQLREQTHAMRMADVAAQVAWRERHPLLARMHDAGIWRFAALTTHPAERWANRFAGLASMSIPTPARVTDALMEARSTLDGMRADEAMWDRASAGVREIRALVADVRERIAAKDAMQAMSDADASDADDGAADERTGGPVPGM